MNSTERAGTCERCQAALYGHLGVFDTMIVGIPVIAIRETSPRNWICCDACGVMLCHDCCNHPETGYCDVCLSKYGIPHTSPQSHQPHGKTSTPE